MTTAPEAPISSAQPLSNATSTSAATTSSSHSNNIVPVFATDFQLRAVENEIQRLNGNFSSGNLKNRIGKVIDIFNHPLHAMIPGYNIHTEGQDADIWRGSGKTLFLQQLIARLEDEEQVNKARAHETLVLSLLFLSSRTLTSPLSAMI
jgi:hypothetical protein